jgi:hypothetical protein
MTTSIVAMVLAILTWVFIEIFGRTYPAKATWLRLRRARGRYAVRRMRERFHEASVRRAPRVLVYLLLAAIGVWVAAAGPLERRWYEVLGDAAPSLIVILALLRTPRALRAIAERMKDYEREMGEDPDKPLDDDLGDGGVSEVAL